MGKNSSHLVGIGRTAPQGLSAGPSVKGIGCTPLSNTAVSLEKVDDSVVCFFGTEKCVVFTALPAAFSCKAVP